MQSRIFLLAVVLFPLLLSIPSTGAAQITVDPLGVVEYLIADPVRNVFYASVETDAVGTDDIIIINASTATITGRITVTDDRPGFMEVSPDGTELYVAMGDAETVAVYDLPGVNFNQNLVLTDIQSEWVGMAATNERLYIARIDGLSIVDTTDFQEVYNGDPTMNAFSWNNAGIMRLNPAGDKLYALNRGLSPASLYAFDVSTDTPVYLGEDCCHGCLGVGRDFQVSEDGEQLYVATSSPYYLQVLNSEPLLHQMNAVLTGPYPNAVVTSTNGDLIYVGYSDNEFAVIRTSDWLPFYVGTLVDDVADRGLALSFDQSLLAVAIEFPSFDPETIQLVNVGSLVPNRGGIKARVLDDIELVPIRNARIADPNQGNSDYIDVKDGYVGRAPVELDPTSNYDIDITAPGHATEMRNVNITAGVWTDLGNITMTRTGTMPDSDEICASPAADIGRTVTMNVTGRGFFPGEDLLLETTDPNLTIDSWSYLNWSTISATVTLAPTALPGWGSNKLKVTLPDGQTEWGNMVRTAPGAEIFDDGVEFGTTARWSESQE